jgi:hypothetical protein
MYPQRTNPNIIIDELYKNLSARYSQEGIDQGIDNAITALRDVLLCRLDAKNIVTLVMREAVSKSSSHSSQENRTALKILYHALERTGLDQFRPLCAYLLGSLSENLGEMSAAESYYLGALEEALAQQNKKIAQQSATELARISGLPEFGAIDKQGGKRGAERAERRGRST